MRRRLFWAIAGVSVVTGLLVLGGAAVAAQRAAVDATRREMAQSADEVAELIEEAMPRSSERPGAVLELLRIVQGGTFRPTLARVLRSAGGSELALAGIGPGGELRSNDPLFSRVPVDVERLAAGTTQFTRSARDELVVLRPAVLEVRAQEVTLVVGLARSAPVVRVGDLGRGWLVVGIGMILLSALLARVLSSQLVSRLAPLSAAARRLADGEVTARVPDLGDPELAEVAVSFNEMAAQLEASREREREFLLGVGHDLRTPLTTIRGYAEALESGETGPGEMERVGSALAAQTRRLGRLIEDLTLLARLEQPEFGLRFETVEMAAHVAEVVEGFRHRADELGVRLSFDAAVRPRVETDPDRLAQVTQNLVENALRFTPEAGEVRVAVGLDEEGARLEVSDTGVGIDPEDLPHVFDRHYVGRRRRVHHQGSGLGLSIVWGLVERLGGSVSVESTPGEGTMVTVTLPASGELGPDRVQPAT